MVNIEPETGPLVEQRAHDLRRTVANYLEWLVINDLKAHGLIQGEPSKPATAPPAQLTRSPAQEETESALARGSRGAQGSRPGAGGKPPKTTQSRLYAKK